MTLNPIIVLNGPPRVGKDTIAEALTKTPDNKIFFGSFKEPMYDIAAATLGMSGASFRTHYFINKDDWKDQPQFPGNKSVRNLLQTISEDFVKPFFGESFYGERLAETIADTELRVGAETCWVITDGGFTAEVEALVERFGHRVIVVQLFRDGISDFGSDTRGWITGPTTVPFDTTNGNERVIEWILRKTM